jgi:hypothetical protein
MTGRRLQRPGVKSPHPDPGGCPPGHHGTASSRTEATDRGDRDRPRRGPIPSFRGACISASPSARPGPWTGPPPSTRSDPAAGGIPCSRVRRHAGPDLAHPAPRPGRGCGPHAAGRAGAVRGSGARSCLSRRPTWSTRSTCRATQKAAARGHRCSWAPKRRHGVGSPRWPKARRTGHSPDLYPHLVGERQILGVHAEAAGGEPATDGWREG